MRTSVRDVRAGEYFLWRGVPYKKMEDVRWGIFAWDLKNGSVWIGCTALVEYDLKKKWAKKTHKVRRT